MTKKYDLVLEDSIEFSGKKLFRIRALTDFYNVKAGDLGGYIQSEKNLSHEGNAWVSGNAKVYEKAIISGYAEVSGNAEVFGFAKVYDKARVFGNAKVSDLAEVFGFAKVYDKAMVSGNAKVSDLAEIYGKAEVYGKSEVFGYAEVWGNARISKEEDIFVFKNHWSSGRHFTYTKSNKMWKVGCFYGTGQELIEKAYRDSKTSGDHYKCYVDFVEGLERLGLCRDRKE